LPQGTHVLFGGESRVGAQIVLSLFARSGYRARMPDADRLTPATSEDLADALAFALRYSGRKRTHGAGEMMAAIVAKRLVEHLERSGFVVMKKPPIGGGAAIGRVADGR
jgi:hypothetical protein